MKKALLASLLTLACAHDEGRPVPTSPEPPRTGGSGLHAMSFGLPEIVPLCACPAGYTEYTGGNLPGSDNGRGCWKCYDHNAPADGPQIPSNSCHRVGLPVIPCGGGGGGVDVFGGSDYDCEDDALTLALIGRSIYQYGPCSTRPGATASLTITNTCTDETRTETLEIRPGQRSVALFDAEKADCDCPETWTLSPTADYRVSHMSKTYSRCAP